MKDAPRSAFHVISGCSGGGKSALLAELGRRGYEVVEEPGRRIVREQLASGGDALPWADSEKFLELVVSCGLSALERASPNAPVFFDRSLVDVVVHFDSRGGAPETLRRAARRYARKVFLTPPWREIYRTDAERRHDFDAAVAEYQALVPGYARYGYEVVILPRLDVGRRADYVLRELELAD